MLVYHAQLRHSIVNVAWGVGRRAGGRLCVVLYVCVCTCTVIADVGHSICIILIESNSLPLAPHCRQVFTTIALLRHRACVILTVAFPSPHNTSGACLPPYLSPPLSRALSLVAYRGGVILVVGRIPRRIARY